MRFSVLVSVVTAATSVTAFHIPVGPADGVYEVSYSVDGTENHILQASPDLQNRTVAIRGATIQKRSGVVTCKPNEGNLNSNDNGAAATDLANQVGSFKY